ncbi:MAG: 30S ribosomal protein S20 [Eubacteriales bacterium]
MPNIKSAEKRVQLAIKQNLRNTADKSSLKTAIRRFEEALSTDSETAVNALDKAKKTLDKAAQKGLIHKNKAARKKSRMIKKYTQMFKAS